MHSRSITSQLRLRFPLLNRWTERGIRRSRRSRRSRQRGRILATKLGFNPNSSSLGVDVTFLLFGATAISLMTPVIAALVHRRVAEASPAIKGEKSPAIKGKKNSLTPTDA